MKNLLKFVLLVALFISASSEAFSQTVTNNTRCDFRGKIFYSDPAGGCDDSENVNFNVAAQSSTTVTPPAGLVATSAKGRPNPMPSPAASNCIFFVSVCGPDDDVVSCGTPCNTYSVHIDANGNVTIN